MRRRRGCCGRQRQVLDSQNTFDVLHHLLLTVGVGVEHERVQLQSIGFIGRRIRSIEILQVFDTQQQRVDALTMKIRRILPSLSAHCVSSSIKFNFKNF